MTLAKDKNPLTEKRINLKFGLSSEFKIKYFSDNSRSHLIA